MHHDIYSIYHESQDQNSTQVDRFCSIRATKHCATSDAERHGRATLRFAEHDAFVDTVRAELRASASHSCR